MTMELQPVLRGDLPSDAVSFLAEGELVYYLTFIESPSPQKAQTHRLWLIVTNRQIAYNAPLASPGGFSLERGSIPLSKITGSSRTESTVQGGGCCGCSTKKVYHVKVKTTGSDIGFVLGQVADADRMVDAITSTLRRTEQEKA